MAEPRRCNHCGRALDFWDVQEDFIIHRDNLGYGTKHDGDSVHLQLCCDCFDKLVDECAVDPITERDFNDNADNKLFHNAIWKTEFESRWFIPDESLDIAYTRSGALDEFLEEFRQRETRSERGDK